MMAHELIRRSAETGERILVEWDPLLCIGLKALGGDELERYVFSGNDHEGREWIVEIVSGDPVESYLRERYEIANGRRPENKSELDMWFSTLDDGTRREIVERYESKEERE